MELLLKREQVLRGVETAKAFAASAADQKVLQHALVSGGFGKVRLTTTDLELWCQVELTDETIRPGSALVPTKALVKVLKNLPARVFTMRREAGEMVFSAGGSEVRVAGMEAEEFPEVNLPEGRLLAMPLRASTVHEVAYAVGKDETRYALTGVSVKVSDGKAAFAACDGHRLSVVRDNLPPGSVVDAAELDFKGIVPVRLLLEGVRLARQRGASAVLELYEKSAAVRLSGGVTIWSALLAADYPDFAATVPAEFSARVVVPHGALSHAVSRLLNLSKGVGNPLMTLQLAGSGLELSLAQGADGVTSAVERVAVMKAEGTVPVLGLNVRYVAEALARLSDAVWLRLKFDAAHAPVVLESFETGSERLLTVIMPRKL